jgi:hypothetical protein
MRAYCSIIVMSRGSGISTTTLALICFIGENPDGPKKIRTGTNRAQLVFIVRPILDPGEGKASCQRDLYPKLGHILR